MSTRVQIVMEEVEREAFRRAAEREGVSLSDWLRRAARERLQAAAQARLCSVDDLRAFFDECIARERGDEPGWQQHRSVIEESKASGQSNT
jgi:DNA-binding GntR family transcriptional regulator